MQHNIIFIASDHAGFNLKSAIINHLKELNLEDLGCSSSDAVDYPDYAQKLCNKITQTPSSKGILICGTGIGMSIAANRFKSIRAALCTNPIMAKASIEHNDANILVLGARIINNEIALACINEFLHTKFKGEKHQKRIDKL